MLVMVLALYWPGRPFSTMCTVFTIPRVSYVVRNSTFWHPSFFPLSKSRLLGCIGVNPSVPLMASLVGLSMTYSGGWADA